MYIVGRGDKQHIRKIQWQFQIIVSELAVLLRIQHFQHSGRWISLVITAHFIDFIQQHQWILHSGLPDALDQTSRHSPNISPAMTTDLCLIFHTSQADADILFIQCPGNRTGNTCLTGSGRSHQTDDRAFASFCQSADSQKLQHTFFYFFQTIVIIIQNLLRIFQIGIVHRFLIPWQIQ